MSILPSPFPKERRAQAGEDRPIGVEGVDVGQRDAAVEVGVEIVQVLWLGAVDVAGDVEVVVVGRVRDFGEGHQPGIAGQFELPVEDVHDLVDVLGAQAVLVAVLDEAFGCVDHEDAGAGGRSFLVHHNDAGGDAGAVEEVGRQADDALDQPAADQVAADVGFLVAAEEDAVGQDDGRLARALERLDQVQHEGVVAVLGRGHAEAVEAPEFVVFRVDAAGPVLL